MLLVLDREINAEENTKILLYLMRPRANTAESGWGGERGQRVSRSG